jgi:L-serine deaminase
LIDFFVNRINRDLAESDRKIKMARMMLQHITSIPFSNEVIRKTRATITSKSEVSRMRSNGFLLIDELRR